jgi:hypothetical protein|nr:MAG TPA: hypothetical protein [Caudoviricetes sp.]
MEEIIGEQMTLFELWKVLDELPTTVLESTNAIVLTSEGEFEIENIEYKNNQIKGLRASDEAWHDREDYPEENKWIIVKDKDGREFKYHQWTGYCYYAYVLDANGCDGWRSDIDIVTWRYDYSI